MARKRPTSNNPSGRPRSEEVTLRIHKAVFAMLETGTHRDLSMESIAERAAVSRPALYRRYDSVGETVLGALLSVGTTIVPMKHSDELRKDLYAYFKSLGNAISKESTIGRALRGVLADALTDCNFAPGFARFVEERRRPVGERLLQWREAIDERQSETALDLMFGPVLYRVLIGQVELAEKNVRDIVDHALNYISMCSRDGVHLRGKGNKAFASPLLRGGDRQNRRQAGPHTDLCRCPLPLQLRPRDTFAPVWCQAATCQASSQLYLDGYYY